MVQVLIVKAILPNRYFLYWITIHHDQRVGRADDLRQVGRSAAMSRLETLDVGDSEALNAGGLDDDQERDGEQRAKDRLLNAVDGGGGGGGKPRQTRPKFTEANLVDPALGLPWLIYLLIHPSGAIHFGRADVMVLLMGGSFIGFLVACVLGRWR